MVTNLSKPTKLIPVLLLAVLCCQSKSQEKKPPSSETPNEIVALKIKPSSTDSTITNTDVAHYIKYNRSNAQSKLLLFLPGTNGIPDKGPMQLFNTAIEQGYKVINLSYINEQAVARYCKGENLKNDPDCTEKFRTQRIFGTQLTTFIPDEPQDAIMNRFIKLLVHLSEVDPKGNWDMYLDKGKPKWDIITVAGQSQGGGMAAFIAKQIKVNRIITFSGGWDYSKEKEIAKWYASESVTPPNRWFGVYHTKEPMAATLDESYRAMSIPYNHIFPLALEIREGKKAHGEGIRNITYEEMWKALFEDGNIDERK